MRPPRQARAQSTREAEPVHEPMQEWDSPALLDTKNIPARAGFVQRWVRTKVKGDDDQNNVFRKINQGWKPRLLSSVEKGQFVPNIDFQGTDVIGIHGMILMERPLEQHERQAEYNRVQTQHQMLAVTQDMHRVHEPGSGFSAPEFVENRQRVTKGRLAVADD